MRKISAMLTLLSLTCGDALAEDVWQYYMNGNSLYSIAAQGDYIWCAAQRSLIRWNVRDSTYTRFTSQDGLPVTPGLIVPDSKGGVWVTNKNIFSDKDTFAGYFDSVSWEKYDTTNSGLPPSPIDALLPDSKGNVWFGTKDAGIVRFDGTSWKTYLPDEIPNNIPESVTVDRNGVKWLTFGSGVCAFDGVKYRIYKKEDGMAGNSVRRIVLGPDGSLWFCTTGGVSRYDGTAWKSWRKADGLVNSAVSAIAFAPDGAMWFATDGGVSRFDGTSWKSFTDIDKLMANKSSGIAVDRTGNVWVCHPESDNGVSCYDGVQWNWYATWNSGIAGNKVFDIIEDRDGIVWFATDSGISSFDGVVWKTWTTREGLASDQVSGISVDDRNRKWILYSAESNAGVSSFDGVSFTTLTERDGLRSNVVLSAAAEGDTIWFCTGWGLCSFDGSSWKQYPDRNRLISKSIRDIAEDTVGVLWFATDSGLTRLDDSGWKTYTREDGLPVNAVTAVAAGPDGRIWMVADSTVVEFDGMVFKTHPYTDSAAIKNFKTGLSELFVDSKNRVWTNDMPTGYEGQNPDDPKYALFRLDGDHWELYPLDIEAGWYSRRNGFLVMNDGETVWTSTRNGLLRCSSQSRNLYRLNCPSSSFASSVVADRNNIKWFNTGDALLSYDNGVWKEYYPDSSFGEAFVIDQNDVKWFWDNLKNNFLSFDGETWNTHAAPEGFTFPKSTAQKIVLDHAGVKWIIFASGGAVSFDGTSWTRYTVQNGLASNDIKALAVDTENLKWFATSGGVSAFDGSQWKTYTTADGLVSNEVNYMVVDDSNVKWIGSRMGLTRFDGNNWKTHTTADGLPGNQINAIAAGSGNVLWVMTEKGVARFDGQAWKSYPVKEVNYGESMFVVDHRNTLWLYKYKDIGIQLVSIDQDSVRYHGYINPSFIGIDRNNIKWLCVDGQYIASLDDRPKPAPGETPRELVLHHNYPNPFNARTNIAFDLYSYGRVEVEVYNLLGQKVRTLVSGILDAGSHSITWDGTDDGGGKLSSGVYFYRIAAKGLVAKDKMLFLK